MMYSLSVVGIQKDILNEMAGKEKISRKFSKRKYFHCDMEYAVELTEIPKICVSISIVCEQIS